MSVFPGMFASKESREYSHKKWIPNSGFSEVQHLGKEIISAHKRAWMGLSSIPQITPVFFPILKTKQNMILTHSQSV